MASVMFQYTLHGALRGFSQVKPQDHIHTFYYDLCTADSEIIYLHSDTE